MSDRYLQRLVARAAGRFSGIELRPALRLDFGPAVAHETGGWAEMSAESALPLGLDETLDNVTRSAPTERHGARFSRRLRPEGEAARPHGRPSRTTEPIVPANAENSIELSGRHRAARGAEGLPGLADRAFVPQADVELGVGPRQRMTTVPERGPQRSVDRSADLPTPLRTPASQQNGHSQAPHGPVAAQKTTRPREKPPAATATRREVVEKSFAHREAMGEAADFKLDADPLSSTESELHAEVAGHRGRLERSGSEAHRLVREHSRVQHDHSAPADDVIHVTIDSIEVASPAPTKPARPMERTSSAIGFEGYEAMRSYRSRET